MSNLLPKEERKAVWRMYRARSMIAGSLIAIICGIVAIAALVPSALALREGYVPDVPPASGGTSAQNNGAELARAQALLAVVAPIYAATTTASDLIAEALSQRPAGASVDDIAFTSGANDTIVLSGSAGSVDAVNAFTKALQGDPRFTSVSVPVGDLAGTAKGQFTITLTGAF